MTSSGRRSVHVPVMPREVIRAMDLHPGLTVLDGTLGAAGHSLLIRKAISPDGCLIGIDRDPMMLEHAKYRLSSDADDNSQATVILRQGCYNDSEDILTELHLSGVDRLLLDLGLSSDQLADRERGFGFDAGGPLDMRFNPNEGRPAHQLLAEWNENQIANCFEEYGEEPDSTRIAAEIVQRRTTGHPVRTTEDLENAVSVAKGSGNSRSPKSRSTSGRSAAVGSDRGPRNPATRVFQALRIAVNNELEHVEQMLTTIMPRILNDGGIAVILTFHSLEDRIVKNAMKGLQGWHVTTRTPIEATPAEIRLNPRTRSAKLRAIQKPHLQS
jgi:16S rRNA (cytosine1402-N4)-methyltransferase